VNRVQKAIQLFNSNYNCSQAVLAAFADEAGLDEPTALKLASGFGGGFGCSGGTCGALTGAVMAMGLCCGTADSADKTTKMEVYRKVRQLTEEYKLRTGSTICRELMGFDMSTPGWDLICPRRLVRKCQNSPVPSIAVTTLSASPPRSLKKC
jgi:C_GCAxxG_C_C family probable redox protein